MKKMLKVIFLFSLIGSSIYSCTKEKLINATSADEITKELQLTIKTKSIQRVYPVKDGEPLPNTFASNSGNSWNFSNGFLSINSGFNQSYNLSLLKYYEVTNVSLDNGTSQIALLLFF